MPKARTLVGLDVHAAKVVAAILDYETGELRFQRLGGQGDPVVNLLSSLPGPVRATHEAWPTGYGLARGLARANVDCPVAAPGKIPRGGSDRIKTDRRDAENLVRLLLVGKLWPVRVPGPPEEAMRDLVRPRGSPHGSDESPPPAIEVSTSPRDPLRRSGKQLDQAPPRLAREARVLPSCGPGHLRGLPGWRGSEASP